MDMWKGWDRDDDGDERLFILVGKMVTVIL
jgi:hypothetical protein